MLTLKIQVLNHELAQLPRYASEGAAGLDLCAALKEALSVEPGQIVRVPTGLAFAIPLGFEGQVRPRSGLAAKHGVTVLNAPGTIDADYRGEVQVILINHGAKSYTIEPRERIAQLVLAAAPQARLDVVESAEELGETTRGEGGFGSTGTL